MFQRLTSLFFSDSSTPEGLEEPKPFVEEAEEEDGWLIIDLAGEESSGDWLPTASAAPWLSGAGKTFGDDSRGASTMCAQLCSSFLPWSPSPVVAVAASDLLLWAALCHEELGLASTCNAHAKTKPGACFQGKTLVPGCWWGPWGSSWGCAAPIWPRLGYLSPLGEQISTPKGLSSQIIPSPHSSSTQTRGVWHKASGAPCSQGWQQPP